MWGQALLLLLVLQHSRSDSACEDLRCFVDYIRTLTCMWDTGPGMPRGTLPSLTATWYRGHGGTCNFLPIFRNASHTRYTCSSEQELLVFGDTFAVTVTTFVDGASAVHQECGPFPCHKNIKPQPPFNVTAAASPGGYNISWESGYPAVNYLNGQLQYQLRYRRKGSPWSLEGGTAGGQKFVLQDTPTLWLLPQELERGVDYQLQVRAGPADNSHYSGTWSDWSPPSSLSTLPRGTAGAGWVVMPLLAFSLVVTLVAFQCRHRRPWKKLEQLIPSPAPFFQTLYVVHNGDFKKWAGTSSLGATLDVDECGTALPEVFQISPKRVPAPTAPGETAAPLCTSALPAFTDEGPGAMLEPAYGPLSIDTVTVAEVEAYRCLPLDSSCPLRERPPPRDTGSPEPRHQDASSLPSTWPFCREPLPPTWAADGEPGDAGLDLDTVDSGFDDSDCGSPVEGEFPGTGRRASCAAPGGEDAAGATCLPSYVKQWIAFHVPPAEHS